MKRANKMTSVMLILCLLIGLIPTGALASTEQVTENKLKSPATELDDMYNEYASFLEMYKKAQDNNFYRNDRDNPERSKINLELIMSHTDVQELYYTLVDTASDGTPELFLASVDFSRPIQENWSGTGYGDVNYEIFEILGYANGTIGKPFGSGMSYRSHYFIMNNNVIKNYGSGGAYVYGVSYYTIKANSTKNQLESFADREFENYYMGTNDRNKRTKITETMYLSLVNKYKYKRDLVWHPISDLNSLKTELFKNKDIQVFLNGAQIEFDQPPITTSEGRVLVPIRKIAEAMNKKVLWSSETSTAFIDNTDEGLIIPLLEEYMLIADENGYDSWERVPLESPAIEMNGRTLVPMRAFCESLGATVVWDGATKTINITYNSTGATEPMNDMLYDSINLAYYAERCNENPFNDYSDAINDFYDHRPYTVDAIALGISDPFAGINDLVSMIVEGSTNASNIIQKSLDEVLKETPQGNQLNYDAKLIKRIKSLVDSGLDVYSDIGGLNSSITSLSPAFESLNDSLLSYSSNNKSDVSSIFDLSVFTAEEVAYLLTEYEKNVEYLDVFKNALLNAGFTDEATEKAISMLYTEYTNKFVGVMFDVREECVKQGILGSLSAFLGGSGVAFGTLVWDSIFDFLGVTSTGDALKTFYGIYCYDYGLNKVLTDKLVNSKPATKSDISELRALIEIQKAEKIAAYKAMKEITNDDASQDYADEVINEISGFSYRIFG